MSYSLLEQSSINAIMNCNEYIEGFLNNQLGAEYHDIDISVRLGQKLDSMDVKEFYLYSLYCWRLFYYLIENRTSEFNANVNKKIDEMVHENIYINKGLAENDLPKLIFHIAALLITHRFMGGVIGAFGHESDAMYLKNFNKIQDLSPYISKVVVYNFKIKNPDFNELSYLINFKIIKDFISNFEVRSAIENINKIKSNEISISEMMEKQKNLKKEVDDIGKRLDGYKSEYNFVELSSAFTKIRANKTKEQGKSQRNYWICMFTLMAFPIFAIFTHWGKTNFEWGELFFYIPMVTLEILFLYFMRIFYVENKNINSQILQIDLRLSLCEFIQGYVRYRKENNDSDDVLKSFETLIFSPIQVSGDNIPSVLDGANVLAELAGNILKAKENK
ncbi:hypothetical protein KU74_10175 [Pectobacterium brasiliense]|uniref:Uncharacterized protein n=1 Tax=Pectobacterium brasiliense TaxID=180957 RepID=A0A0M2EZK6_9GAMM|nr:hypothetical protein [Pectobacterium brasiliense]KGA33843.1 hypothetical protein KU74_10175 [Pectobacterium brasiliense]